MTTVYKHRGTVAVQRMVEHAPSTGSLALWIHHEDVDGPEGPSSKASPGAKLLPAFNDGARIRYTPAFEQLAAPVQAGCVAHQVLHVALRHAPRYLSLQRRIGEVDLTLYNICADAIVNSALAHLGWLELPDKLRLEKMLFQVLGIEQSDEQALLQWDVETLYRVIDDRPRKGRLSVPRVPVQATGDRPNEGQSGGQQAQQAEHARGERAARAYALRPVQMNDLQPDADNFSLEQEAQHARDWRERLSRGHAGDGMHSMLRSLLGDLPRSHIAWEQVLRTRLARALTPHSSLSWSRPSRSYLANQGRSANGRRMPWEPGTVSSKNVSRLAIMIDVSGSVEPALLARFCTEVQAIARRTGAACSVYIGDDCLREVRHFDSGKLVLRDLQVTGGGGTDFTPLLEAADADGADIGVFLTDLDGPANYRPRFPVVWAVADLFTRLRAPFGSTVSLS